MSHTTSKGVESAPLSTLPVAVDAPATCAPPPRPGSEAPPDAMAAAKLLELVWWAARQAALNGSIVAHLGTLLMSSRAGE